VRRPRVGAVGVPWLVLALAAGGCSAPGRMPDCSSVRRLGIVAQAVPSAAYVPCIREVPEGWTVSALNVGGDGANFTAVSDRANGRRVDVDLRDECEADDAVPTTPRAEGVRTSLALGSLSPRFQGTLFDTFAGGCVSYRFDFPRGPHIALMEELQAMVGLVARRELRLELQRDLDVDIGS
jgi:hypothetical protein